MICFLCRAQLEVSLQPSDSRTLDIVCIACGRYEITQQAQSALHGKEELAFKLATWVSSQRQTGVAPPRVAEKTIEQIRSLPQPNVKKRAELYLGAAIDTLGGKIQGRFDIGDPRLRVASWSYNVDDCLALANYLEKLGAIEDPGSPQERRVVAAGHLIYDEIIGARASASQAFVAMWFNDCTEQAYEIGIEPAVRESGYEALRIDRKEDDGKIDDRIIAEIRRSSFLVADFTGHRGGVYYEAGFAHGLGRRVLFLCKESDLKDLHFDVRQYNTIIWNEPTDILKPLQRRILALFGAGPQQPDAKPLL